MEQEIMKPCPFCGGEAKAWEYEDEQDVFDPISLGWVDTRCVTWHCVGCESCEIVISRLSKDDALAAWNSRAAVTDEQFSIAVHDGEAWQRVRTCHMVPVSLYDEEGVDGIECDECGWSDVHEWYDPMPEFCQNCGAKVVTE